MKPWTDLSKIQLPMNMRHLPRDERGYPIPVNVTVANGKPDFRVMDVGLCMWLIKGCRCGICGKALQTELCFVGGPKSIDARTFTDLPMHRSCATYALQVCPFIAAPRFAYARATPKLEGFKTSTNEQVSDQRPDYFGLGITNKARFDTTQAVFLADPWIEIQWWRHGQHCLKETSHE